VSAPEPTPRPRFKHYEAPGFGGLELCSGRPGFAGRKTREVGDVTCKNCLRILAKVPAVQS
jgi:hypothetical protein